jgi:hypothetical protein
MARHVNARRFETAASEPSKSGAAVRSPQKQERFAAALLTSVSRARKCENYSRSSCSDCAIKRLFNDFDRHSRSIRPDIFFTAPWNKRQRGTRASDITRAARPIASFRPRRYFS